MEEILDKDIFVEKDLVKYSPDYTSQNIFFRMQLRREMVKDTHNHGVLKSSNYQKKNIAKTKTCYKLKKEVEKLRAYFQDQDLQNQCMLKDVQRITQKNNANKNNKFVKSILRTNTKDLKDEFLFVYDVADKQGNLVIKNDNRFQLLNKIKRNRLPIDNYKKRRCKTIDSCDKRQNETASVNKSLENVTSKENCSNFDEFLYTGNEYKHDLQSLLIRMTINSTMDEKTEVYDSIHETAAMSKHNQVKTDVCDFLNQRSELFAKIKCQELVPLLNIQPISMGLTQRQKYIITKYVNLWKVFVNTSKENRLIQDRQATLKQFFEKLAKKKNSASVSAVESTKKVKGLAQDYSTYQHRYKIQKHIIALQKAKLEEQNKLIDQLKYNKIVEDSRLSIDNMKEDIRRTYYEIDKHLKPKIKCLTNDLKIKEIDDSTLVLHCLKVPQFLQRMEARAREREEKHAIIRERRKQLEEERIRLKQQVELSKAEMDKEEKIKKIKELREKRKREKVENIRKKQHAERMRALTVMADLHYEKNIMVKFGIRPLKLLIEIKHDNMDKAKGHYRFQLMKNVFLNWMWHTEDMWFERNYKAEIFYRKSILGTIFQGFKKNHYEFIIKKQVAEDYYDLYVTQLVFRKFRESIKTVKKEFEVKWTKAIIYYNSNILFRTFTRWTSLPALNALKRDQDARKLKWRQKVLLVVPDYTPPED